MVNRGAIKYYHRYYSGCASKNCWENENVKTIRVAQCVDESDWDKRREIN